MASYEKMLSGLHDERRRIQFLLDRDKMEKTQETIKMAAIGGLRCLDNPNCHASTKEYRDRYIGSILADAEFLGLQMERDANYGVMLSGASLLNEECGKVGEAMDTLKDNLLQNGGNCKCCGAPLPDKSKLEQLEMAIGKCDTGAFYELAADTLTNPCFIVAAVSAFIGSVEESYEYR